MKKSRKIAIVVGTFPVISQTFIVNQVNALIDKGYNVNLYAFKKGEYENLHQSYIKHNLLEKVNVFKRMNSNYAIRFIDFVLWTVKNAFKIKWNRYFKTLNIFKYGKEAYSLKLFYGMHWCLVEDDFDIIHVHFAHNAYFVAYLKTLGLLSEKTKLITTIHGYDLIPSKSNYYKNAYRNIYNKTDLFTVNSLYTKAQLQKLEPQLKNISVLPVGLDTAYFSKIETAGFKSTFEILFCGRLITLKGPELAIRITELLLARGYNHVRLHLLGDGPLYQDLQTIIRDKKLDEIITIEGKFTQEELKSKLEKTNVLIMPGIKDEKTGQEEAQGLVIQEAQAMKVPVVVSDVGGMKYGLIPNETGFVVEAGNLEGFADCIEKLILDKSLAKSMGESGAKYVKQNFDNRILIKRLIDLYESVLNS
ncbi:MAG: colanic acid biosynthesis glycosyltransferase WcaL [Algicola sp.]|nr:colanic acid biosynthesis glycosyltransferase WcaL [Algicola sp.]